MIVFDLQCEDAGHRFEGWFGSSDDFASQQLRGLVACPQCSSTRIAKAVMAPNVGRKGNQLPARDAPRRDVPVSNGVEIPAEVRQAMQALMELQVKALEKSRWVGGDFVEESRAMHYGEREIEAIHGQATLEEAKALIEEGIEIAALPFPIAPPGKAN